MSEYLSSRGFIYVMASDGWKAPGKGKHVCKVGRSNDPYRRALEMQAPSPIIVVAAWTVSDMAAAEAEAFSILSKYRVYGEFFRLNPTTAVKKLRPVGNNYNLEKALELERLYGKADHPYADQMVRH